MVRGRLAAAAVSAALCLLAVVGCGGAARPGAVSTGGPAASGAWTTVRYGSVALDVPAAWPVYDLSGTTARCARFDVNALYLGHQQPHASCPAKLLGRTDAAQIEPLDARSKASLVSSGVSETINGQPALEQPNADVSRKLTVAFPQLGVLVTASYLNDPAVALRIVNSVRAA